jgi:hypothetical protein
VTKMHYCLEVAGVARIARNPRKSAILTAWAQIEAMHYRCALLAVSGVSLLSPMNGVPRRGERPF